MHVGLDGLGDVLDPGLRRELEAAAEVDDEALELEEKVCGVTAPEFVAVPLRRFKAILPASAISFTGGKEKGGTSTISPA